MRIALAQINPTVGDITANSKRVVDFARRAKDAGATLAVFPELCVIGYPPKDLLLKPQFIEDNRYAVRDIARQIPRGLDAIVGYAERNDGIGKPLFNAVAVLRDGRVVNTHFKSLLPTYDVFDESRYFEPGPTSEDENLVRIGDQTVGLSICEDLWNDERLMERRLYRENPIADLNAAGAQVLINSSASPFHVNKHAFRLELFAAQAKRYAKPLLVVNQVGGNDELIFDGNSVAFDAAGSVIAHAKDFEEDLLVFELPGGPGYQPVRAAPHELVAHATQSELEQIHKALVLGLRDYVHKCGFKSVVLGLSGGIDSALTAALAVAALGKEHVVGVAMPSRFSSHHSIDDARRLAENLGIQFHVVPISEIHQAYEHTLAPAFAGTKPDVTEENLQARARGALLMAFSNKFNHLLLTTGNKSELAVGYCTLYGDMCGGLAVISDVPKTTVWELAKFINQREARELIPQSSIDKVPSAELRPNQTDQDSLPPYPLLDQILHLYVEEEKSAGEIIREGFDAATVTRIIKLIDRSEYKRRQAAPGLRVTSRAFGMGRRMPIAQNYIQLPPRHGEISPTIEQ
jgi:NAD+ synthase (glutamine-hydrolysing)